MEAAVVGRCTPEQRDSAAAISTKLPCGVQSRQALIEKCTGPSSLHSSSSQNPASATERSRLLFDRKAQCPCTKCPHLRNAQSQICNVMGHSKSTRFYQEYWSRLS
uniref:WGS project CBMG000000000 data, contig CS5907-c001548 n=1 Tax=Fusarium acuminatum CS5907 TaxID=1318461 RepID=A0A096PEW1_9HYPO|nr:unnamed protein product [Fusarium acuminatum CS5907]